MGELDARLAGEFFYRQVRCGAVAGGAVAEFARIGFGKLDQIGDRFVGRVGLDHDAEGVAGQAGDVGEVAQRVELHFLHVRQACHTDGDLRQGVAVGCRLDQLIGPQHAAGTRLVLDHHLHTQCFAGAFAQRTHDDVA
jgi:hypothetical protein